MNEAFLHADTDTCAGEAISAIDAVLAKRCPDSRSDFWRAVEKHYRPDTSPRCQATAAADTSLVTTTSTQTREETVDEGTRV